MALWKHTHLGGLIQKDTRRCIVCGAIEPLAAFITLLKTPKRSIPGWTDNMGRFNRGYVATRKKWKHELRCSACRNKRKEKKPKQQHTFNEVMEQINISRKRARKSLKNHFSPAHAVYEGMRNEYLKLAAHRARLRRAEKKPMPFRIRSKNDAKTGLTKTRFVRWQYLLTQPERDHLRSLYSAVRWGSGAPDLF